MSSFLRNISIKKENLQLTATTKMTLFTVSLFPFHPYLLYFDTIDIIIYYYNIYSHYVSLNKADSILK